MHLLGLKLICHFSHSSRDERSLLSLSLSQALLTTVNFLNIRTPNKIIVVITLKFELCGSAIA